jgi:four helix bundle protein
VERRLRRLWGEFWSLPSFSCVESSFQRLAAYRRSVQLADEVHAAVSRWDALAQWSVGIQLLKSVDSVGANIAEAAGRTGLADRRRFFVIARGSLYETKHWLTRANVRGLLPDTHEDQVDDIARALSGLIKRPGPT